MDVRRLLGVALVIALLSGCSGGGAGLVPASQNTSRHRLDTPGTLPADTPGTLPADTPGTLPAGAVCGAAQAGEAKCTIAVNLSIPPLNGTALTAALIPGLQPNDLRAAYHLPSGNSGGTVAIVDAYDDPLAESDLNVYRTMFGLGSCTAADGCLRKVDQTGGTAYPSYDAAWSEETSLDLDMVSAVCPHCKILLVEANSDEIGDLAAAVDEAVSLGATVVSNSYYMPEYDGETAQNAAYAHPGVAIVAAAGDDAEPSYPAVLPTVTAVGGTTLTNGSAGWTQTPWGYGGHGCSAYIAAPTWQRPVTSCKTRSAVDLSVVADPQTGVAMFDSAAGGFLVAGGTSVGAPIVAAAYALSGDPAGPAYAYANASAFTPIGDSGYQAATGLGSPNGTAGL